MKLENVIINPGFPDRGPYILAAANQNHGICKSVLYKQTQFTSVNFSFCLLFDKISKAQPFANKMHLTELVKAPWQQFLLHSNQLWPTIYTMWNFNKMLKNKNTGHCEQIFFQYNLKIICKKKFYLEKRWIMVALVKGMYDDSKSYILHKNQHSLSHFFKFLLISIIYHGTYGN